MKSCKYYALSKRLTLNA
jgi:hypothetical protein